MEKLKKPSILSYTTANVSAYYGEDEEKEEGKANIVSAVRDSSRTTPNFWERPMDHITQRLDSSGTVAMIGVGAVKGAISGAKLGAAIGSAIAPGPGTVVGGVYGAAAGTFAGAASSAAVGVVSNCAGCHVLEPMFLNKGK